MPLLSADPRVTRSRRSWTALSSCAAGTTRLTSPHSSALRASMTSPDMAISAARLRPMFRAMATIGVWQNQPPLPPGAAKPASSLATARSALATSWHPAAVASPCTRATTGWGTCWISVISSVQVISSARTRGRSASATSAKSCPALNTGPLPASTMPRASLFPTSAKAAISSRMCSSDRALRRCGRFIVTVANSPDRSTRMCSKSMPQAYPGVRGSSPPSQHRYARLRSGDRVGEQGYLVEPGCGGDEDDLVAAAGFERRDVGLDHLRADRRAPRDHVGDFAEPAVVMQEIALRLAAGLGSEPEVGQGELARPARAARVLPGLIHARRGLGEHVGRTASHDPAVGQPGDPAEGGLARAAQDDLGAAGPGGLGPDRAGVAELLTGPDPLHHGDLLFQPPPAALRADAARREVVLPAAQAQAQDQAPAGEPVERGRLLGEQRGVRVERRQQHARGQPDLAGDRRGGTEGDKLLVVGVHEAADRAQSAEPSFLGMPSPVDEGPAFGVGDRVGQADSDLHAKNLRRLVWSAVEWNGFQLIQALRPAPGGSSPLIQPFCPTKSGGLLDQEDDAGDEG